MESQRVIKKQELQSLGATYPSNTKTLALYNWVEGSKPTIIVPGKPPIFNKPRFPLKVARDDENNFIDENHYRQPNFPTEAIFKSVEICSPEFLWDKVDFVTDRNNLRKLMRFIKPSQREEEPFTILLDRRGNTVIMTRKEENDVGESMGYGHNFEKKVTTSASKTTSSCRRVINYDLGGVNIVVRNEVDAAKEETKGDEKEMEEITKLFSTLGTNAISPKTIKDSELEYINTNTSMKNYKFIELKTTNKNYAHKFDWEEAYGQLSLGVVDEQIIGYHLRGTFESLKEIPLDTLKKQHTNVHNTMGYLACLLKKIHAIALEYGEEKHLRIDFSPGKDFIELKVNSTLKSVPSEFKLPIIEKKEL